MIIIGAGLAGLLCGAMNPDSQIYEAGPEKEINHLALLRMRNPEISKVTGIPFKKVSVTKSIWFEGKEHFPSPRLSNLYSRKVTGFATARSINNIDSCIRYIPPSDFISILKDRIKGRILYNTPIKSDFFFTKKTSPVVSTIPLPLILKMVGMCADDCTFLYRNFFYNKIVVNKFEVEKCNSYCTVYYPAHDNNIYRATIDGNILIIESTDSLPTHGKAIKEVCNSLGIDPDSLDSLVVNHIQKFGKIVEIDNATRQKFIVDLTIRYGIYSLGRFATWRPKILLDDVLDDIFVIRRLIQGGHYSAIGYKQN